MRRLALLVLLALASGSAYGQGTPPPDYVTVDKQPVPLNQVQPEYPEDARQAGIEGRVTLRLWVRRDGAIEQAQVLRSDNAVFDEAALTAARQWTFEPAMKDGRPVDVWVTLPIRFRQNRPDALGGTWEDSTRTFRTSSYEITLPEGLPRPQPVSTPGSDGPSAMYASEAGEEAFMLVESPIFGADADTSLSGRLAIAQVARQGTLEKSGARSLAEPEEIVTSELIVSRLKVKNITPQGKGYYGVIDVVLPRRGTAPMVILMYLSTDPATIGRPAVLQGLSTFRFRDLGRAPFLPADPFAVLNGEWQWEGSSSEATGGPFTLTVSEDRSAIHLDYRDPITAPDGSRRASFTYRVLGHEGAVVRTTMEGETRMLASGEPIGWDFVLRSEGEFCWRQADLPEGTCTPPLVRVQGGARSR